MAPHRVGVWGRCAVGHPLTAVDHPPSAPPLPFQNEVVLSFFSCTPAGALRRVEGAAGRQFPPPLH